MIFWQGQTPLPEWGVGGGVVVVAVVVVVGNSFMVGSFLPRCRQGAICVWTEHTSPSRKNTQAVYRLLLLQPLSLI